MENVSRQGPPPRAPRLRDPAPTSFILLQLSQPPICDAERHSMFVIREKLRGFSLPLPKSRSTLLMELAH